MNRLGVSPRVTTLESPATNLWFNTTGERLNVYSGPADPTVDEVPENQWIVYNNTTVPEVRLWTNISGTLLKSAAFT